MPALYRHCRSQDMRKRRYVRKFLLLALCVAVPVAAAVAVWNVLTSEPRLKESFRTGFHEHVHPGFDLSAEKMSMTPSLLFTASYGSIKAPDRELPLLTWEETFVELNRRLFLRGFRVPRRVTVNRPTLEVRQCPERKIWNIEEFLSAIEVDEPRFRELLRDGIHVENAVLRLTAENVFGDGAPRIISGIHMTINRKTFLPGVWIFTGRVSEGPLGGMEISGSFGRRGLDIRLVLDRLDVDSELLAMLPFGDRIEELFQPGGRCGLEFRLHAAAGRPDYELSWRGRVSIDDMKAASKFYRVQTENLAGSVDIIGERILYRDITGLLSVERDARTEKIPLNISGTTDMEERRTVLNIAARGVPLTEETIRNIPASGDRIWEEFAPAGSADIDLTIDSMHGGGAPGFSTTVQMKDVSTDMEQVPFPLRNAYGTLFINEDGVWLQEVRGNLVQDGAEAGRMLLNGRFDMQGKLKLLMIEAENVGFSKDLLAMIPGMDTELLEAINPSGFSDVSLTIGERDEKSGALTFTGSLMLSDTMITPPDQPLRLEALAGRLDIDNEGLRLDNVRGRIYRDDQYASIALNGLFDVNGQVRELEVDFKDFSFDTAILSELPGIDIESFRHTDLSGIADGTITIRDAEKGFSAVLHVASGSAETPFFSRKVEDISGTIHIADDFIQIKSLAAMIESEPLIDTEEGTAFAFVDLKGKYDIENRRGRFRLNVEDINLTREIVGSIPGRGMELRELLSPSGLVSISGSLDYNPELYPGGFYYHFDANLKNASALWDRFPLFFSSLCGRVLISNDFLIAPNISGMAAGGRVEIWAAAHGIEDAGDIRYDGAMDFQRLDLRKVIRETLGREVDVAGKLSGMLEIAGSLGEEPALKGQGEMILSEGRIWKAPVFMGLVDILHLSRPGDLGNFDRGQFQYVIDGGSLYLQHFELRSPAAELTGWGELELESGALDLTIVAMTTPEGGIPILSPAIKSVLRPIQRELIRVRVSGTIEEPQYSSTVITTLTRPVQAFYDFLTFPMRIRRDDNP